MSQRSILAILLGIVVSTAALPAHATTIAVTTATDELNTDGDCSLREAVRAANTNAAVDACPAGQNAQTDTITVPAGTYTLTLAGNDNDSAVGDLDLRDNAAVDDLAINGAGAATTIIQACAVEQLAADCPAGQGIVDRVLHIFDGHVAISGLTIRHGRASAGSGIWVTRSNIGATVTLTDVVVTKNGASTGGPNDTFGGGIVNNYGALTLTRTTVSDNRASLAAGISNSYEGTVLVLNDSTVSGNTAHGYYAGGISNDEKAVLTCINSTISGNHVGGAPVQNQYSNSAGGLHNFRATATLTGCTVSDNVAQGRAGGIMNWTTHPSLPATMTLTDSTISGNRSETNGPAAFWNETAAATFTNCTISGNEALSIAGGIYTTTGMMDIRSTTITANRLLVTPHGAGGIWAAGPMVLRNTIIAGNFDETSQGVNAPDCFSGYAASPVSEGYSLVGDGNQCPGLVNGVDGNRIGTLAALIDAKLGPLADYGGPTFTHALMSGSPAIDGGNPAAPGSGGTACPTTDQRGEPRPTGAACDIGSVESVGSAVLAASSVQPTSGGTAGTVQLRVYGEGFVPGAVVRLVRAGFADVVGGATSVLGTVVTASLDLRSVAPGTWSVEVENPSAAVATLADAFTVVAGGEPDVWVDVQTPGGFQSGRLQSIYVFVGNRGAVDAYGVPLWVAFGEPLQWFVPFVVSPPPAQPGQIATDWSRIGIDLAQPMPSPELPEKADTFHFLLPVVPAGSSNAFRIRVRSPLSLDAAEPGAAPVINVAASIGDPYLQPDLSADVVAFYVSQAKGYAARAHHTTTFPSDAAIEAYVRTQLTTLIEDGRRAAVGNDSESLPIYSQVQLIIDAGQFIARVSATAEATSADRSWLARIVAGFAGRPAEAYDVGDPDLCKGGRKDLVSLYAYLVKCENENDRCAETGCDDDGLDREPNPCENPIYKFIANFEGIDCRPAPAPNRPKPTPVPFRMSDDPNHKSGPGGPGGFIDGVTPLNYTVTYENVATASGDAFEVTVTDQLDVAKYALDTFSLGPISFGNRFVPVPAGLKSFSTEVDMRPAVNILVGIDAGLDMATGIVTWKFTTLDPATHQFPEEPVEGFLPPNVTSPEGEGEMLFTVSLKPGLGLGTTVCNDASIVFDFNAPIVTNEHCNTIGAPEDCENCIDDDGDGKIDRADADCGTRVNGGGVGADTTVAKAVNKCAKTIRKVGAKLTSNRLKQLGACEKAVADCVQLKGNAAACLLKAQKPCTKARTGLPTAETKLTDAIVKACGEPALAKDDLFTAVGVGFDGEVGACGQRGLASVDTTAEVADCVRSQHACAAERMLGAAVPRARELLVLGGFAPADLACVPSGANGGGLALAADKQKAIRKCDAAIQKATAKLAAGRAKAGQACGGALFTCVQTKPGDPCLDQASGGCTRAFAALPKLADAFTANVRKACGAAPLVPADLLASDGLGASALSATCAKLGIASLTTVDDVSACLAKQVACSADHLLDNETPRFGELLDLKGIPRP